VALEVSDVLIDGLRRRLCVLVEFAGPVWVLLVGSVGDFQFDGAYAFGAGVGIEEVAVVVHNGGMNSSTWFVEDRAASVY